MRLSHRLELRVSEGELRSIRERAARARYSVSGYVRMVLLQPSAAAPEPLRAYPDGPSDSLLEQEKTPASKDGAGQLIILRLSRNSKESIREKALASGLSLSAYVRRAALERDVIHRYDQAAARQLKRIGVNLNQAVMLMHRGDFSEDVKESFRRCLTALEMELSGV